VTPDEVNRVLGDFGRPATSGPVTVVLAGQRLVASPREFGRALSVRADDGRLVPQVDGGALLSALAPQLPTASTRPVDAQVVLREGRPAVVPSRVGITVDQDRLASAFLSAVTRHGAARRVVVPGRVRQPAFTTADADALGVDQRVSSSTVRFGWSDERNRKLVRAVARIDGTLLRPGQTFSLESVVGGSTGGATGTEQSTAAGTSDDPDPDGSSALASAVFQAMFFAGLHDVAHTAPRTHAPGGMVGLEATLVWPSADLRFTDDSRYGVLVGATLRKATTKRPGALTVTMWSTKRWDVTARTGPRTDVQQPTVRDVATRTCQPEAGSPGFDVDVVRVFRRPGSAQVVRTETFHTDYRAGRTVRCDRVRS
jgi:vancomycin resistance protein YoaR